MSKFEDHTILVSNISNRKLHVRNCLLTKVPFLETWRAIVASMIGSGSASYQSRNGDDTVRTNLINLRIPRLL